MSVTLIKGVNIGEVPPTPTENIYDTSTVAEACTQLRKYAYKYGIPTGYKQEQDGRLINSVLPNPTTEFQQISSSSKVNLELHTETAFHPYKPSHVLLLCLRGDHQAPTTFAIVDEIVESLDNETVTLLKQPLYITAIDDSFRTHGEPNKSIVMPILMEDEHGLSICFDEFFMRGQTFQAQEALDKLKIAIAEKTREIVLEAGDLFVLDNRKTIHGRKPFSPRYDGTDRWVLRCLVVDRMPPDTQFVYEDHMMITTEM